MFTGDKIAAKGAEWASRVLFNCDSADDSRLQALLSGDTGVLVLRGLLSEEALSSALNSVEEIEDRTRVNSYPNAQLITVGPYLAGCVRSPQVYFDAVKHIACDLPPPLVEFNAMIYRIVAAALGLHTLKVATENADSSYSPFIVLIHRSGMTMPLHNDMIARDAKGSGLFIANTKSQLRCVVCLQECTSGGELIHYRKPWSSSDESLKVNGHFGYPHSVVDGFEKLVFRPMTGDIYIFNPTYYHEVAEILGTTRVTMGFFFGHADASTKEMFAWS